MKKSTAPQNAPAATDPALFTRRDFLRSAATGAILVAGAPLLFASDGGSAASATSAAPAAPKKLPDLAELFKAAAKFLDAHPYSRVPGTETRIYDAPVFAVSSVDDPLYPKLKDVVGKAHLLPQDWFPAGKSVVAWFLPYSAEVSKANHGKEDAPELWIKAHHQGAYAAALLRRFITKTLADQNVKIFTPYNDKRYRTGKIIPTWSERHVGYISGLGTFGVSTNLITAKGASGRLDSFIADGAFPATKRPYAGLRDYCENCLACVGRCPVGAITEKGKNVAVCARRVMAGKSDSELGVCGKCLTAVPCERCIPPGAKALAPAAPSTSASAPTTRA